MVNMKMNLKVKCEDKYELVVPDGGWGYMICLAGVLNLITTSAFIPSFGLIYNDFMKEIGLDTTGVTLVTGVNAMCFAFGGFLTTPLLKVMSLRQLTLVTILIYNIGTISMIFVRSVIPFFICVGVIQGAGFGVILNLTYTMINEYFVEKRLFAYSVIKTSMAIFVMFAPQLVKISLAEYGFKGTILMTTAVGLQSFIAVALMQPVAWHMKRVKILPTIGETQILLIDEKTDEKDFKLKVEAKDVITNGCDTVFEQSKPSWITNLLDDLFDVPTIKSLLKTNLSWGVAMTGVVDLTYMALVPLALYSYGWNKDYVALAISAIGLGDLAGRACFIVCSKWLPPGCNYYLFIGGMVISVVARVGCLLTSNVIASLIFLTIIGVARCFFVLFFPLTVCDEVGNQKFTAAMGFIMAMMGVVNLTCGPVLGAIRDYTQSYDITFWVLAAVLLVFSITCTIELLYKKRKQANNENKS